MTTYRPYTKEDKLEVGRKFRGLEFEIVPGEVGVQNYIHIQLKNGDRGYMKPEEFEGLEIEDIPPPPLTIDKRVKEELINRFGKEFPSYAKDNEFVDFLNSLEEV